MTETPAEATASDAPRGSALASLRDRRKEAASKLFIDLEVPRLEPAVFVRFGPIPLGKVEELQEKVRKSSDKKHRAINANAALLVEAVQGEAADAATLGVFEVVDGKKVGIDGSPTDWPKFDERLAELLECSAARASDVVRGLYLTEGDIVSTVGRLLEWNGFAAETLEADVEGN